MKISKALKVKNRLAGEVAALKDIFKRENSRRNDNPSKVSPEEVLNSLTAKRKELIVLKGKISIASAGIAQSLSNLAELKLQKNFLAGLPTREGEEVSFVGRDQEKLVYTWTAFLNREALDDLLAAIQDQINNLQDEVDTFNASTDI